jgi:excisionase family DNA binding protein
MTPVTKVNRAALVEDGLVDVNEAADFLGISRSAIYNLMGRGELPFAKIGGSRRIPRRSLRELAAKCLVAAELSTE